MESLPFQILVSALACAVLVKSAELMIKSSSRLARFFKISEYTISFLVIAFATSLPELIVGVSAALDGKPILSLGNVIGSNIADLTIILGIPVLVGGAVSTKHIIKNKDLIFACFFGLLLIVMMFDGNLSRLESIVLILGYIFYIALVLKKTSFLETVVDTLEHINAYKEMFIFAISTFFLIASSEVLVNTAEGISASYGASLLFIGLTLTAVGTSLPELVFGLKAMKRHKSEVVGNIIGSVIANSTVVIGLTGVIAPITGIGNVSVVSSSFLFIIIAVFFIFSHFQRQIGRFEASVLILIYIIFVAFEKIQAF